VLLNAEARQRFFQEGGINRQASTVSLHIFNFVEGAEETELGRGVLFRLGKRAPVSLYPRAHRLLGEENADGISELAVGSDVKDKFRRGRFRIVGDGGALAHEVVLVDISLRAGVSLQAADGLIW
jgi:hypothetical protein